MAAPSCILSQPTPTPQDTPWGVSSNTVLGGVPWARWFQALENPQNWPLCFTYSNLWQAQRAELCLEWNVIGRVGWMQKGGWEKGEKEELLGSMYSLGFKWLLWGWISQVHGLLAAFVPSLITCLQSAFFYAESVLATRDELWTRQQIGASWHLGIWHRNRMLPIQPVPDRPREGVRLAMQGKAGLWCRCILLACETGHCVNSHTALWCCSFFGNPQTSPSLVSVLDGDKYNFSITQLEQLWWQVVVDSVPVEGRWQGTMGACAWCGCSLVLTMGTRSCCLLLMARDVESLDFLKIWKLMIRKRWLKIKDACGLTARRPWGRDLWSGGSS